MSKALRFFTILIFFSFLKPAHAQISASDTVIIEDGVTAGQFYNYALEFYDQNDFDNCIAVCKKILVKEPSNSRAEAIMAHAFVRQKLWDSCILYGNKAIVVDNVFTQALYVDLRDAYRGNMDWEGAKTIGEKFLRIHGNNEGVNGDISFDRDRIGDDRTSGYKVNTFFVIMVLLLLVYYLPRANKSNDATVFDNRQGLLEMLLVAGTVGSFIYFLFFHFAPAIRSTNLKLPDNQFLAHIGDYPYEHDGMEGIVLYAAITAGVFSSFLFSLVIKKTKDSKLHFAALVVLLVISYLFFHKTGFFPPVSWQAAEIIPVTVITLGVVLSLYVLSWYSWKTTVVICSLCLIPISFVSSAYMSFMDSDFILAPALRLAHGFKPCEIYFQYDFYLSLIALAGIKLNMPFAFFERVVQCSIYALLLGILLFSRSLFKNKALSLLLLAFAVIVRIYANQDDILWSPQISPLRLDLWLILIILVYWKNPFHWCVGLAMGLLLVLHRNFGYIYLSAYLQLLVILFIIDIIDKAGSKGLRTSFIAVLKNNFRLLWKNALIIALSILAARVLFGGFVPAVAKDYGALGLGMIPISSNSFYWYAVVMLALLTTMLLKYRRAVPENYFRTGLFIVLLSIGNSLYFLGRSHENNLVNISAILSLALFVLFDIIIFIGLTI